MGDDFLFLAFWQKFNKTESESDFSCVVLAFYSCLKKNLNPLPKNPDFRLIVTAEN